MAKGGQPEDFCLARHSENPPGRLSHFFNGTVLRQGSSDGSGDCSPVQGGLIPFPPRPADLRRPWDV
ncbi:hypothetical protein E2C01_074244 [Portunus trituberculatus]|uniref:Uncharacterized protein n=1 Tax=Portunus trituberculatus TaxID=210409 RepID=A0A5B7IBM8_PORTR|nr:hypothetical protein [Portunus trituberculatus]